MPQQSASPELEPDDSLAPPAVAGPSTLSWWLTPAKKLEAEAQHLYEIEEEGTSGETPIIAIATVILFLLPIFLFMLGLVFAAYSSQAEPGDIRTRRVHVGRVAVPARYDQGSAFANSVVLLS